MAGLPPLLPTPPASLKLRDTAVESRAPKRHRPLEPPASDSCRPQPNSPPSSRRRTGELPPPPKSKVRRRSRSPPPSSVRRRSRSPPPPTVQRRSRSPPPSKRRRRSRSPSLSELRRRSRSPPPSKVWRRSRSPLYVSVTQQLVDLQRAKPLAEGERSRPLSPDESLVENRLSRSHCSCKHPETSSATVENRPDPAIQGHEQKLDSEKIDGKNQSDDKAPSRSARRKKMKRQIRAEVIKEMRETPSRDDHRKNMKRQIWAEAKKEFREMKKDKLLENIKKLQACVWLLEKDGADMAKIMEFRSLLESAKKQYVENEAQLAKEGSSAPLMVLNKDRLEKTHVETIAAPVEKVDRDEQSMDSGKGEVRSLNGCEEVSDENELAEEVNRLKSELETVRQDRDYQLAQAQSLMADIAKQKEVARRYELELEDAMMRVAALEKGCLLRRETIKALQIQLASANEKLTTGDSTIED
ncbi:hypothetical protein ACQ4PT_015904 [Festuca glaucescens]